jgi:hypothetical protein
MIDVYQKQVFETRETICQVTHNDRLLQECNKIFKNEISDFRKTTTALKRAGIFPEDFSKLQLWRLISTTFETVADKRSVSQQRLLLLQLKWLASDAIVSSLGSRLAKMNFTGEINIKRIRRDEQKYQHLLEKEAAFMEGSTQVRFINFTNKMGDYKGSLSIARAARELGEEAHRYLRILSEHLKEITFWGKGTGERPAANDHTTNALLEQIFISVINAYVHLCAFKTEVSEFAHSRDLDLHFQAVMHFKDNFFNCLIADWVEARKLRMTGFCVQKTVDSLGMLMQGLNSRIFKLDEELEIIHEESSAILLVAEKIG